MTISADEPDLSACLSPRAEYERRREARRQEEARLMRRWWRLARMRNGVLGLVVAIAWLTDREALAVKVAFLTGPGVVFVVLVLGRNATRLAWRRAARATAFYEQRLAHLDDNWSGRGRPGSRYLDDAHPCARDLDLFGVGCLFEMLCLPCSRCGEDTLAAWLRSPAGVEEVRERQAAVADLAPRLDLRERLALLSTDLPAGEELEALAAWARATPPEIPPRVGAAVRFLGTLPLLALVGGCLWGGGLVPFLVALGVARLITWTVCKPFRSALSTAEVPARLVRPLSDLVERLQLARFTAPLLVRLKAALLTDGRASHWIKVLGGALRYTILDFLLVGPELRALSANDWRKKWGTALVGWLKSLGEVEALNSLAAYAFENPADPFPEVVTPGPCFDAEGLGHPLLPRQQCVANDVRLADDLRLLIVSGSNMSGKSTLLRSVGVNAVLALAGAPVRARRLRLSPLVVGATLRVQDSLQAGRSRFYAEVLRVRQLLDLSAGSPPLLFLLDELFGGTNSHDRQRGAEAVLRRLVDAGAIGLVTTHDLALTQLAGGLAPRAANVHFTDCFADGALSFDYRMRPGVVPSTNGVALMRAVGIEV